MLLAQVPVRYAFVADHLKATDGTVVRGADVAAHVRSVGLAATVPAWTKQKWEESVLGRYTRCRTYLDAPMPGGFDNRKHLRIVFTHQLAGRLQDSDIDNLVGTVRSVLVDGATPSITQRHYDSVAKPFHALTAPADVDAYKKAVKNVDVAAANAAVKDLHKLVHVESIFTSMQNVNTVVVVQKDDLPQLHAKLKAWVKLLSDAHLSAHQATNAWVQSKVLSQAKWW